MSVERMIQAALAVSNATRDGETLPEGEGWHPKSPADVDWGMERMGEIDTALSQNAALEEEAIRRIRERMAPANAALRRERDYREACIKAYASEHRGELLTGKAKSRTLPNGNLAWRKTGGRLKLDDTPDAEAKLLAWAQAEVKRTGILDLVRVKESPALKEIVEYCDPTPTHPQIVPPGMHWEEEDEYGKLEVKPAEVALANVSD